MIRNKENKSNEQEIYGPWMQVTNWKNRNPMVVERNGGKSTSQIKGTLTIQRFVVLSDLESKETMPNSTAILPNFVKGNNRHGKSNEGNEIVADSSRPIYKPKMSQRNIHPFNRSKAAAM